MTAADGGNANDDVRTDGGVTDGANGGVDDE
jgi:hypothetical protein